MDFCSTDKKLTASSVAIAIGAFGGLWFFPNNILGALGGMAVGGIVGGAIITQVCKK